MKKTIFAVLLAALCSLPSIALAKNKLEGAWRVTEVQTTGPNARTISTPQPGLYIFTGKHYSVMTVNGDKPRPEPPADMNKASADEVRAIWGPFTANAGTYELVGDTLTTRPTVAKQPNVMRQGNFNAATIKLQGNNLTITSTKNANGPVANPTTTKLTRVE